MAFSKVSSLIVSNGFVLSVSLSAVLALSACSGSSTITPPPPTPVVATDVQISSAELSGAPADFSGIWLGRCAAVQVSKLNNDCTVQMNIHQTKKLITVRGVVFLNGVRSNMRWADSISGNDLGVTESGRGHIGSNALLYDLPTFTLAMRFAGPDQINYVYRLRKSDQPKFQITATLIRQ
jgi:hypothetical protein